MITYITFLKIWVNFLSKKSPKSFIPINFYIFGDLVSILSAVYTCHIIITGLDFFIFFICRMQKNSKNKMWWSSAQLDKDPSAERGETHFGGTSSGLLSRRCPIVFYIKIFPDSYRWSPWLNLFGKCVFCSSWQPFWRFSNIMSKTLETRLSVVCGSKCLDSRTIFRC